jgi:hypothetical protein
MRCHRDSQAGMFESDVQRRPTIRTKEIEVTECSIKWRLVLAIHRVSSAKRFLERRRRRLHLRRA